MHGRELCVRLELPMGLRTKFLPLAEALAGSLLELRALAVDKRLQPIGQLATQRLDVAPRVEVMDDALKANLDSYIKTLRVQMSFSQGETTLKSHSAVKKVLPELEDVSFSKIVKWDAPIKVVRSWCSMFGVQRIANHEPLDSSTLIGAFHFTMLPPQP